LSCGVIEVISESQTWLPWVIFLGGHIGGSPATRYKVRAIFFHATQQVGVRCQRLQNTLVSSEAWIQGQISGTQSEKVGNPGRGDVKTVKEPKKNPNTMP
jgi:hypothetical protein